MTISSENSRETRKTELTPWKIAGLATGLLFSYWIKDAHFLSLNFEFASGAPIYPDLMLIFLIFFALYYTGFASVWFGFFTGLLEDGSNFFFTGEEVHFLSGVHSLVYCLIAFAISQIQGVVNKRSLLSILGIVFVCSLLGRSSVWLIQGLFDEFSKNYAIFSATIYTAFVSPVFFTVLHWVYIGNFRIKNS